MIRVLFVCRGNICRSPTAEAVFKHYVAQAGFGDVVLSDSAGTHDYHIGDAPDERSQRAAARRGYDLSMLRARQIARDDFSRFDYLLAMDDINLAAMQRLCQVELAQKPALFMSYGAKGEAIAVPDPYYGGAQGFERVLDMTEDAAQGLLRHIRERHKL